MHLIQNIINTEQLSTQACLAPLFRFEMMTEATKHNDSMLKSFDFDLQWALDAQVDSLVYYGSEFRSWRVLQQLFHFHPLWKHIKLILKDGATFPLALMTCEDCLTNITFMLKQGNHKSVEKGWDTIKKLI